jgi:hypothetical protein
MMPPPLFLSQPLPGLQFLLRQPTPGPFLSFLPPPQVTKLRNTFVDRYRL